MTRILRIHSREFWSPLNRLLMSKYTLKSSIDIENYLFDQSNLNWIKNIFVNAPTQKDLLDLIIEKYSHIELYHSCCPRNLRPYYRDGIILLDTLKIEREFKELINDCITSSSDEDIQTAIDLTRLYNTDFRQLSSGNAVCLHYDKRNALKEDGFSIYGGEYMTYLINHYPKKYAIVELINIRKTIGIPTLLTVRLPLCDRMKDDDSFVGYVRELLFSWASRYIYKERNVDRVSGSAYNCKSAILPELIHRHEHPPIFCVELPPLNRTI